MIFICVKWKIKPEHADQWPEIARDFTEKTRAEEGNRSAGFGRRNSAYVLPVTLRVTCRS